MIIRLFAVDKLHPFELFDLQPAVVSPTLKVAPLEPPVGPYERAGVGSVALEVGRQRGKVQLVLTRPAMGREQGKPFEVAATLIPARDALEGQVVFVPVPGPGGGWAAALVGKSDKPIDRPWEVDRYYWQIRHRKWGDPADKAWPIAWSIYCKYKAPEGDEHCTRPKSWYLTG